MTDNFETLYTGHERKARKLLLDHKYVSPDKLALYSCGEVEKIINEHFIAYKCDEDWLLVPKDKQDEFNKPVTWICR